MSITPDPIIGSTISGRYVVKSELGQGGMGAVYLATQQPLGRKVALKVLKESLIHDDVSVRRFYKEAQAVAQLNHPNIVTIYDFGSGENGILFLAMELLKGKELLEVMSEKRHLSWEESLPIVLGTCRALAAAHAEKIVHRDLKPDNVMLIDSDLGDTTVKVLDFGLAKIVQPEAGTQSNRLTSADVIMGTPGYMSPEQINGQDIDARTDLYSLGVLWWEMLVGKPLFDEDTPIKILVRHIQDNPTRPSDERPDLKIPPEGEALILRLLSKSPEARPRDGEHTLSLVQGLLGEKWSIAPIAKAPLPSDPHDKALEDIVDEWAANFTDRMSRPNMAKAGGEAASATPRKKMSGNQTMIATPVPSKSSFTDEIEQGRLSQAAHLAKYTPDPWLVRGNGQEETGPAELRFLERSPGPNSPALPKTPGQMKPYAGEPVDIDSILYELQNPNDARPNKPSNPALRPASVEKEQPPEKDRTETPTTEMRDVNAAMPQEKTSAEGPVHAPPPEGNGNVELNVDALQPPPPHETPGTLPPDKSAKPAGVDAQQPVAEADPNAADNATSQESEVEPQGDETQSESINETTSSASNANSDDAQGPAFHIQSNGSPPSPEATQASEQGAAAPLPTSAHAAEPIDERKAFFTFDDGHDLGLEPEATTQDPPDSFDETATNQQSEKTANDSNSMEEDTVELSGSIEKKPSGSTSFTSRNTDPNSDFAMLFLNNDSDDAQDAQPNNAFWGEDGPPQSDPSIDYWSDLENNAPDLSENKSSEKQQKKGGSNAPPLIALVSIVTVAVLYMFDPVFLQPYRDALGNSITNARYSISSFFDELIFGPPPPPMENPLSKVREQWISDIGLPSVGKDQLEPFAQKTYLESQALARQNTQVPHEQIFLLHRQALLANPNHLPAAAAMLYNLASHAKGEYLLTQIPWKQLLAFGLSKPAARDDFLLAKAALMLQQGKAQDALEALTEQKRKDPLSHALRIEATNHINPKLSRTEFNRSEGQARETERGKREEGVLYRLEGNWPKSEQILKEYLSAHPQDARAVQQYAHLKVDQGKTRSALKALKAYLKQNAWDDGTRRLAVSIQGNLLDDPERALALSLAGEVNGPAATQSSRHLQLEQAALYSVKGSHEQALAILKKLKPIKSFAQNPKLHIVWGQDLLRRKKGNAAKRALQKALSIESSSPITPWVHTLAGESALLQKQYISANESFSWALNQNKAYLPARIGQLATFLSQDQIENAKKASMEIFQGDPLVDDTTRDHSVPFGIKETVRRSSNRIVAIEQTDENYELKEMALGLAAYQKQDNQTARTIFERILSENKEDRLSRFMLAALDLRTGKARNALDRIDALQGEGQRGQGLWALRSRAELKLNMLDQAKRSLGKLNNPSLHLDLKNRVQGEIELRDGKEREAEKYFIAALQAAPHNKETKDRLKKFYKK